MITDLLDELRRRNVELTIDGDRLRYRAPAGALTQELLAQLRSHRAAVLERLRDAETFEPWALQEWRRVTIPDWRRILQESIAQGDAKREAYARWMLREVLLDAEYREEGT